MFSTKKMTLITLLFLLFFPFFYSIPSYAKTESVTIKKVDPFTGEIGTTELAPIEKPKQTIDDTTVSPSGGLKITSMKDFSDLLVRKGFEVASLLKNIGSPLVAIFFVYCCFLTLFGAVSKTGIAKGLIGMFITGIVYILINYSGDFLNFFLTWFAN